MIDIADDHIIFVNTQNNTVNAIINSKLTIAKSFGIDATCLSINEFTGIDDIDLCRLLSNMLENAITATANIKLNAKQINLKIISESEKYTFLSIILAMAAAVTESLLFQSFYIGNLYRNRNAHTVVYKSVENDQKYSENGKPASES